MTLATAPELFSLQGGVSCDIRAEGDCSSLVVIGQGFVDSADLLCEMTIGVCGLMYFFFVLC